MKLEFRDQLITWSRFILPLGFAALGFVLASRVDEDRSEWIIKLVFSLAGGGLGYVLHLVLHSKVLPAGAAGI